MKDIDWKILLSVTFKTVAALVAFAVGVLVFGLMALYLPPIVIWAVFALMLVGFYIQMEYKTQVYRKNRYK